MSDTSRIIKVAEDRLAKLLHDASSVSSDASTILTTTSEESGDEDDVALELTDLDMKDLPSALIPMMADKVSKLSLQGNFLQSLPPQLKAMTKLLYLDIRGNSLTEFPMVLTACPNLEILDLSENFISRLPASKDLGFLETNLRVLSISSNNFTILPPCIADITSLQFLEIENNPLVLPPPEITCQSLDVIKNYLVDNRAALNTSIEQTAAFPPPIPTSAPPPPPVMASNSPLSASSTSEITYEPSSEEAAQNVTAEGGRFRSNSSSRAAKRMGLIVKKPRMATAATAASDESTPSPVSGSVLVTPGTASSTENGQFPDSFHDLSRHVRAMSHDSNHDLQTQDYLQSGTASHSVYPTRLASSSHGSQNHQLHPPQPLSTQPLAVSSVPSSPFLNSRDTSPMSSRQGSIDISSRDGLSRNGSFSIEPSRQSSIDSVRMFPSVPKHHTPPQPTLLHSQDSSPHRDVSPGAYFKRLSTLPEESRPSSQAFHGKIVEVSRQVLYSVNELFEQLRRCSAFCDNKSLLMKLSILLNSAKSSISELVEALEDDAGLKVVEMTTNSISAVRNAVDCFRENLSILEPLIDIKFLRSTVMICFTALYELRNAYDLLNPGQSKQTTLGSAKSDGSSSNSSNTFATTDDQLYDRVYAAASAAQSVLGQLTEAMSQSAMETASQGSTGVSVSPITTAKMRDLTSVCVSGVDVTRRLKNRMEIIMANGGAIDRRGFWENLNAFLKSVIAILASTKSAMSYLPFLGDVRPNLTILTRLTKEIPVLLEYSSYKILMHESRENQSSASQRHDNHHTSSIPTDIASEGIGMPVSSNLPPPPTTPLVAVLGPAAQAVLSPQSSYVGSSPFIPQD